MMWQRLDFPPLREDIATDVSGGCVTALDVDLSTKIGSVKARKQDTLLLGMPASYPVPEDIHQAPDGRNGSNPYAMLTRNSVGGNITGLAVKGFKKIDGTDVAEENNGWHLPPKTQPPITTTEATLQHDGHEVRVHCQSPKYYGLPRSINEAGVDWPYCTHDPTQVFEDDAFLIDAPFGEGNDIRAPHADEIYIATNPIGSAPYQFIGNGISYGYNPMWGDPGRDYVHLPDGLYAQFRYAYWGVSYLYDGYQESPLYVQTEYSDVGNFALDTEPHLRIRIRVTLAGIVYATAPFTSKTTIPRRVRKIRIYCGASDKLVADPRKELQFRLVNELDVKDWDKDSQLLPYKFPARRVLNPRSDDTPGITVPPGNYILFDTNASLVDAGTSGQGFTFWQDLSAENGFGAGFFMVDGSDTEFRITEAYAHHAGWVDTNQHAVILKTSPTQQVELAILFPRGNHDFHGEGYDENYSTRGIKIYQAFRRFSAYNADPRYANSPVHHDTVGNELLFRATYSELSGLPQTLEDSVSPPRNLGTNRTVVPLIADFTDADGRRHSYGLRWPLVNPAGVTCWDIFPPENTDFRNYPIVGIAQSAGHTALFGQNKIELGTVNLEEKFFDVTETYPNIGAVSKRMITETSQGIFFLSHDGIRVLNGLNISDPISRPIQESLLAVKAEWANGRAWYSATKRQYVIHFPTSRKTFVYDFVLNGWIEVTMTLPVFCGSVAVDGEALLGKFDPFGEANSGIYQFANGEPYMTPQYSVKTFFDDPDHDKHIRKIKAFFTENLGQAFDFDIACENQTPVKGQDAELTRNAHPTLESGVVKTTALRDRGYTVTLMNFAEVKQVRFKVEAGERESDHASG